MVSREDYFKRVMVLAQHCYPEHTERVVHLVFSSIKQILSEEKINELQQLLPEAINDIWNEVAVSDIFDDRIADCITLAKEKGNYPYRTAVEREFEVVFAALREVVDDDKRKKIKELLPPPAQSIFDRSASCALDGSAADFL